MGPLFAPGLPEHQSWQVERRVLGTRQGDMGWTRMKAVRLLRTLMRPRPDARSSTRAAMAAMIGAFYDAPGPTPRNF